MYHLQQLPQGWTNHLTQVQVANEVDFKKESSKRWNEYVRIVAAEYNDLKIFRALEDKIIDNLRHQTKEYCDVVCAVASLDQQAFWFLDYLEEKYLRRKYEKRRTMAGQTKAKDSMCISSHSSWKQILCKF